MGKGVITSNDLDRGEALTGIARQDKLRIEEQARNSELELERAIAAEVEKRIKAKSKRRNNAKQE